MLILNSSNTLNTPYLSNINQLLLIAVHQYSFDEKLIVGNMRYLIKLLSFDKCSGTLASFTNLILK